MRQIGPGKPSRRVQQHLKKGNIRKRLSKTKLPTCLMKEQWEKSKEEDKSRHASIMISNGRHLSPACSVMALTTCKQSPSTCIRCHSFALAIKMACRDAQASAITGDGELRNFLTDQPKPHPSDSRATTATRKKSKPRTAPSKLILMMLSLGRCQPADGRDTDGRAKWNLTDLKESRYAWMRVTSESRSFSSTLCNCFLREFQIFHKTTLANLNTLSSRLLFKPSESSLKISHAT